MNHEAVSIDSKMHWQTVMLQPGTSRHARTQDLADTHINPRHDINRPRDMDRYC